MSIRSCLPRVFLFFNLVDKSFLECLNFPVHLLFLPVFNLLECFNILLDVLSFSLLFILGHLLLFISFLQLHIQYSLGFYFLQLLFLDSSLIIHLVHHLFLLYIVLHCLFFLLYPLMTLSLH